MIAAKFASTIAIYLISHQNYNWPLLVIMGGFFATAISGLFAKNAQS